VCSARFLERKTLLRDQIEMLCDLLVVGGGVSGIMAAITACEQGASVIVADLAHTRRSGDAGHGNDHLAAYLNLGGKWDTSEEFLNLYVRLSQGFVDREVVDATSVSVIPEMIERLENSGIQLKDSKTGKYIRTGAFDQPQGYYINFEAADMKPRMVKEARRLGAKMLNRVMIVDPLLGDDGRIIGAVGFNIRSGEFYLIRSRGVLLSTGSISQIWKNPTPYMFNVWHGAYNGGAPYCLAWHAGAEIANCELSATSLVPKGFSAAGFNAIFGMGGHLVNALGERFTLNHHPRGERGPRWLICWAVHEEKKASRGPVYVDVRHLSPEAIEHLTNHLLPVDKLTFIDYLNQKRIDLSTDLLEVDLSEQALPGFTGKPYGIIMDRRCWTGIPGLYVAGATSTPCYALSGAFTTGISAGREAGKAVLNASDPPAPKKEVVKTLREKLLSPLKLTKGIPWQDFERKRQQIMTHYVGFERHEQGLLKAMDELGSLETVYKEIKANNFHELMRTTAAGHLLDVSKLVVWGALERKESRFGHGHHRTDYPETEEAYHGSILLKKSDDTYKKRFVPAQQ